jgi:hypothetical protein
MKTKIVSAIYFDLHGTDLGGRPSRNDHYLYSMNSIMNIDNCKFIIYTNDKNRVNDFFQQNYADKMDKFISIEYNLYNTEYKDGINFLKDINLTLTSMRCIELQYSKFSWMKMNIEDCDYLYWLDAGLCYSGLLPDKYLKIDSHYYNRYYGSNIFTLKLIENINNTIDDKIFIIGKENQQFFWDIDLPDKYYQFGKDLSFHVIGGMFGGKSHHINTLYTQFYELCNNLLQNEHTLYSEENILTTIYFNNKDKFYMETFDVWWHENNIAGNINLDNIEEFLLKYKSFYKILEKFF